MRKIGASINNENRENSTPLNNKFLGIGNLFINNSLVLSTLISPSVNFLFIAGVKVNVKLSVKIRLAGKNPKPKLFSPKTLSKQPKANSLDKMLSILDLFTEENPIWSVDNICKTLEYSRSTAYRYSKELADAGLLFQIRSGSYGLGSRIILWDRQLRLSDPLVIASKKLEATTIDLPGEKAWLVCRLFKDQVICIHHFGTLETQLSYSRGLPRPLFKGATSKAILAFLPNTQHIRLFEENPEDIKMANLGNSWNDFKKSMQAIRKRGFAISFSEIDKNIFGIAAPIKGSDGKIQGSLSCVRTIDFFQPNQIEQEGLLVCKLAKKLSKEAFE